MAYVQCVMGIHGSGKSTLSYKIAAHYKQNFKNCKIINEVARSARHIGINEKFNVDSAHWIFNTHWNKKMEAVHEGYDYVICDRSCMDSLLYAKALGVGNDITDKLMVLAKGLMHTYDKIIYVQPDIEVVGDSVRPTDVEFYNKVFKEFDGFLKEYMVENLADRLVIIKSSEIFQEELPKEVTDEKNAK